MTADRITELRSIFAQGKRGATIAAGEELIAALQQKQKPKKPRQMTLFAPTLDEVKAYAKEIRLNSGEEIAFFDHHEAKGWKMGRNGTIPIRNFKAALRTWQRNCVKFAKASPGAGKEDPKGWQDFLSTSGATYRGDYRHAPEYLRIDFSKWKKAAR